MKRKNKTLFLNKRAVARLSMEEMETQRGGSSYFVACDSYFAVCEPRPSAGCPYPLPQETHRTCPAAH